VIQQQLQPTHPPHFVGAGSNYHPPLICAYSWQLSIDQLEPELQILGMPFRERQRRVRF